MTTKKYILTAIVCLFAATANVFGQSREITEQDFTEAFVQAYAKQKNTPYRAVGRHEKYKNGKLLSTTEITAEYIKIDHKRYLEVEKFADRTRSVEVIIIGEKSYCRTNGGAWKPTKIPCAGDSLSNTPNVVSKRFTIEAAKPDQGNAKIYRQYIVYENFIPTDGETAGVSYHQGAFWVDDKGFLVREETERGSVKPNKIYWLRTGAWEYNPKNLKVEAPIK